MSEDFRKVVRLGTVKIGGAHASVYCQIQYRDGRLSISGVEGPRPSGNCLGGCGQIDMHLRDQVTKINLAKGWTFGKLHKFFAVWQEHHLNDMKAGTPMQERWLKDHKEQSDEHRLDNYQWSCKALADAGLNPDNGYSYGTAWLKREVPQDAIEFLKSLPDTDKTPAWV